MIVGKYQCGISHGLLSQLKDFQVVVVVLVLFHFSRTFKALKFFCGIFQAF